MLYLLNFCNHASLLSRIYTGDFFATRFEDFLCVKISRRAVTHTRQDAPSAIAFEKNRRQVDNTCDLRCRLYFARVDARIILARDHLLTRGRFQRVENPTASRARINSKSYAIYESPRHSAMHKCFASRCLRLS